VNLLQTIARSRTCRLRHRFSRWSYNKVDYGDGYMELDRDVQIRMCLRCGHQEIRERVCE
jgi:hypothetical protein